MHLETLIDGQVFRVDSNASCDSMLAFDDSQASQSPRQLKVVSQNLENPGKPYRPGQSQSVLGAAARPGSSQIGSHTSGSERARSGKSTDRPADREAVVLVLLGDGTELRCSMSERT